MEKINFRFLNYKHYDTFKNDLEVKKVIRDDSIVFIQDKLRIWARGKEYICDGQYTSDINLENGLILKNKYDNTILLVKISENNIRIWDGKGTPISFSYVSPGDLDEYVTIDVHNEDLRKKQDALVAGRGIQINGNQISAIIDNLVYVFVDELPDAPDADKNKIYVVDHGNGLFIQYVVKNNQWVTIGQLNLNVDLSGYLKKSVADGLYQPKGDYAYKYWVENKFENYIDWVNSQFVKKVDVYTPEDGYSEGGSSPDNPYYPGITIDESILEQYEKKADHLLDLSLKQNILIPGKGIHIVNDRISTNLANVAYSGKYSDLTELPDQIVVDFLLSDSSTNPVQNRAIYAELLNKADSSALFSYVTNSVYEAGMRNKQDKLTAGNGITISELNVISTNIDTQLYIIVSSLSAVDGDPDPNKIYLVETPDGNGGVFYYQYRYKNGQWIPFGLINAQINLSEYLKSADAEQTYQHKRDDFVFTSDLLTILSTYSPLSRVIQLENNLSNYVQFSYLEENYQRKGDFLKRSEAEDIFVKKIDVYTPNLQDVLDGGSNEYDPVINTGSITVDSKLSLYSTNPVENRVITAALNNKQDKLTAGNGILISNNNTISVNVDTEFIVITTDLNNISSPSANKIYFLESTIDGLTSYTQYKWDGLWIQIGEKVLDVDLSNYITSQNLLSCLEDYVSDEQFNAYKEWAEQTFAKSQIIIGPQGSDITVDSELDESSANPVENRAVTIALLGKVDNSTLRDYAQKSELSSKADISSLSNYVLTSDLTNALNLKQDLLQAGDGISIINNVISSTIDTDLIVITDNLLNINTPNANKIYLLETIENGDTVYIEYRWKNNDWVEIGYRTPEVNLTNYYTKQEADALHDNITDSYLSKTEASQIYQTKISDYATSEDIEELDEKFDDYATKKALKALKTYADNKFLSSGNYALAEDVATALQVLQTIIDQKYVLKRDVYRPNEVEGWSTSEATAIAIQGASGGSSTGGSSVVNNMVTLSESSYQQLVDANMIEETTYYFTYEDEEETNTNWTFGGTFPVILSGDGVGTFPITLT